METSPGLWYMLGWGLIRFGIPVAATILVCWLFKKLDARWQAQAEETRKAAVIDGVIPLIQCWLFNNCPDEQRLNCVSYQNPEIPCWQHRRAKNGELEEGCLGCGVFRGTPAPAIGD